MVTILAATLLNAFILYHSEIAPLISEVDSCTSTFSTKIDTSGKKYTNAINGFIPSKTDTTCPYVSSSMKVEKDEDGKIVDLALHPQFIQVMQSMFLDGGSLFFKDTLNHGDILPSYYFNDQCLFQDADRIAALMVRRMAEASFIFKEVVTLHFDGVPEQFLRFQYTQ